MQPQMNRTAKFIFLMVILILMGIAITNLFGSGVLLGIKQPEQISFSDVLKRNDISSVSIQQETGTIHGHFTDGSSFESQGPSENSPVWTDLIHESTVSAHPFTVSYERPPALQNIFSLLSMIALPLMLFALVYFLLLRPVQMRPPRM